MRLRTSSRSWPPSAITSSAPADRGRRTATSTTRFAIATAVEATSTTAITSGRSCVARSEDRLVAEPVEVEDGLGDDRAADEQRDVEAEHRDDRRQARAETVPEDDLSLAQAFRARGADVVLAERLEQVAARDPRVDRGEEHREHAPRSDQVREPAGRDCRRTRCSPSRRSSAASTRRSRGTSARARTPARRCRRARSPWRCGR